MHSSPGSPRPARITDLYESLFPTGEALLSAIRGHHVGPHPLTSIAYRFGQLHQQRLHDPACPVCPLRAALSRQADHWVAEHAPPPHPDAVLHSESLGTVIDRLAVQQVHAFHLLMTAEPSAPDVHAAWYRLAELIDDYTDLTTAVVRRARRLPALPARNHLWAFRTPALEGATQSPRPTYPRPTTMGGCPSGQSMIW
ncbi:DUF4254 domain-containing protein [Nocardia brevicatena]|uniref:DUF4254 domain-containing protein n=1 Tax=Nocardia brevicatena TaxID=37327 RepID=UPI00031D5887|nr:DUF4254 domain-containing protein [Nocardia brevicatena]